MGFTTQEKDELVASARDFIARAWPDMPPQHACLHSVFCVCGELQQRGIRFSPQGGSMSWPRLTKEQALRTDAPSHLSYKWSPDTFLSQLGVNFGQLPEMHIWVALIETEEIIDIQTKYFPLAMSDLSRYDWPGIQPPDYLWCGVNDLPDGVIYKANEEASLLAIDCIIRVSQGLKARHNVQQQPNPRSRSR